MSVCSFVFILEFVPMLTLILLRKILKFAGDFRLFWWSQNKAILYSENYLQTTNLYAVW